MEQERTIKPWKKILIGIALLLFLMCILALLGYRIVRKKAPQETPHGASYSSETQSTESDPPFHLPTAIRTTIPEPEESAEPDNDYLILAEETAVNLYILTENGDQVYAGDLPIALSALMPEDQSVLTDGIIVGSDEELAALLEDYSS